jgi:hypothetical protein
MYADKVRTRNRKLTSAKAVITKDDLKTAFEDESVSPLLSSSGFRLLQALPVHASKPLEA